MTYSIVTADLVKNKKDIFNIWEQNYPGVIHKKFEWIYQNNPAGPPCVWLVRQEESREYVGVTALFPRRFVINGKSVTGGIAGDLLINKDHRSAGPALMLQRNVLSSTQQRIVHFIYGFPNNSSEPILKRAGYKVFGERVRLVKILKSAPQLLKLPFGKFCSLLLSPLFDFILKLISPETWSLPNNKFIYQELDHFDERFDQLWTTTIPHFTAIGERVSTYLTWRFLDLPDTTNKIFSIFDKYKNRLTGYIIYQNTANSIEIKDFLYDQDHETFSFMFSRFLRHARSTGAHSVSITLLKTKKVTDQMTAFGFAQSKGTTNVLIYFPKELLCQHPSLEDTDNWLLLQSDDDDI